MVAGARDAFRAYHTDSRHLTEYMARELRMRPGDRVLEPCAGRGALVSAVLKVEPRAHVDAFEVQDDLCRVLRAEYAGTDRVRVEQADTVDAPPSPSAYDKVIANPPFGAWFDHARRDALRREHPNLYVKESYSVFLYLAFRALKPGGRAAFIIPDTFLYLHRHRWLRRTLLSEALVESVAVFPSSFFPGVSYGYSKLCILVFRRTAGDGHDDPPSGTVSIRSDIPTPGDLARGTYRRETRLTQASILGNLDATFLLSQAAGPTDAPQVINEAGVRIGDVADCVTGFYSGDDRSHLRCADPDVRGARRYRPLEPGTSVTAPLSSALLGGIEGPQHFVRIKKGGPGRYLGDEPWYVDWSTTAVANYRADRKARFQNSRFYFQRGIAVPMVSSSGMRATLMDGVLFDQSIVGVFPHDPSMSLVLLAYFNSATCTALAHAINPTANRSANYVKKIPFPVLTNGARATVEAITQELIDALTRTGEVVEEARSEIDAYFADALTPDRRRPRPTRAG